MAHSSLETPDIRLGTAPAPRDAAAMRLAVHRTLRRVAALCLALLPAVALAGADEPGRVTGFWRCRDGDALVLADRPCGADAVREGIAPADVNGYEPVPPPASGPARRAPGEAAPRAARRDPAGAAAGAGRGTAPVDAAQRRRLAECRRIGQGLHHLESRLRAGYSGRQGERLRARQNQLAARRWQLRCRATELAPAPP